VHSGRTVLRALTATAAFLGALVVAPGEVRADLRVPAEVTVSRLVAANADTYVAESAPAQTAGATPRLIVDGAPRRVAYLRFAVPAFDGRLRHATLRLHVSDVGGAGSVSGGSVLAASDTTWDEATTSWTNRPPLDGAPAGGLGPVVRNRWVSVDVTALVRSGRRLTLGIRSMNADDAAYDARGTGRGPRLVLDIDAPPAGVIVDAVGDLVCGEGAAVTPSQCHQVQVSDLIVEDPQVEAFLALGDLQYNAGSLSDFQTLYEPTYGRVKGITFPVIGNHKYQTPDGDGYWDYWGEQAGPRHRGWYSVDLPGASTWHLVALNSNCGTEVHCGDRSPQVQWLRADLQANDRPCVLAFFHHPRWSSGEAPGDNPAVAPFVRVLQRHDAEAILSGHSHNYERFARQRPDGTPAAGGIRQFVVGTGGRSVGAADGFARPFSAHSQFRLAHVFGLLRLSLSSNVLWWSFVDENGRVRDSGTDRCH
jgi:acid phosphatase type 7